MKIFFKFSVILFSVIFISNFYACKSKTETYVSDKGKVKIEREGERADITIKTEEGETFKMTVNKGKLPEGWPSEIPVLPGGDIVFSQTEAKSNMKQISIETKTSVADALDFYKKTMESSGWNVENTISMPQMNMINAKKDSKELMLQIVEDEGKTHIQIIIQ